MSVKYMNEKDNYHNKQIMNVVERQAKKVEFNYTFKDYLRRKVRICLTRIKMGRAKYSKEVLYE